MMIQIDDTTWDMIIRLLLAGCIAFMFWLIRDVIKRFRTLEDANKQYRHDNNLLQHQIQEIRIALREQRNQFSENQAELRNDLDRLINLALSNQTYLGTEKRRRHRRSDDNNDVK